MRIQAFKITDEGTVRIIESYVVVPVSTIFT